MPGSGATPARSQASRIWRASSRCAGRSGAGGCTLTVASSGSSRSTSKSAVTVPSEVCRVRCVVIEIGTSTAARMAPTISSNVRSKARPPSSRRACTCTTPAPASTARLASLAISPGVYGSFFATLRSRLPLSAATIRIGSAIYPSPRADRSPHVLLRAAGGRVGSQSYPGTGSAQRRQAQLAKLAGRGRRRTATTCLPSRRTTWRYDAVAGAVRRDGPVEVAEAGHGDRSDGHDDVAVARVGVPGDLLGLARRHGGPRALRRRPAISRRTSAPCCTEKCRRPRARASRSRPRPRARRRERAFPRRVRDTRA